MPSCTTIDPLVTPYVDGELSASDREGVEAHIRTCAACHSRIAAERAVRTLLHDKQPTLQGECAPPSLRMKCHACLHTPQELATGVLSASARRSRTMRYASLATAASLLVLTGGVIVYGVTGRSSRVMAAELAADHVKCLTMNAVLRTHQSAHDVENAMASGFGWTMRVPEDEGLELVGSRPCLYGQGKIAHVMYRHNGRLLSLFMLPKATRSDEIVEVFGHQCVIWSDHDRTFVLVSRGSRNEAERLAAAVHRSLE